MPHLTSIKERTTKVDLVAATNIMKKPNLPVGLLDRLLKGAMEDACNKNTYGCEVLNDFENEHGCEVSDISYRGGILSIQINDKFEYNFKVEITEIK